MRTEKQMKLTLIRGTDRKFGVKITKDTSNSATSGDPFDLTGATEIRALFGKEDGTVLVKTLTAEAIEITDELYGKISISLTDTETGSLKVGEAQSFEIEIHVGPDLSIVQFKEVLDVVDRIFTGA